MTLMESMGTSKWHKNTSKYTTRLEQIDQIGNKRNRFVEYIDMPAKDKMLAAQKLQTS